MKNIRMIAGVFLLIGGIILMLANQSLDMQILAMLFLILFAIEDKEKDGE